MLRAEAFQGCQRGLEWYAEQSSTQSLGQVQQANLVQGYSTMVAIIALTILVRHGQLQLHQLLALDDCRPDAAQ